jgi:hypothetical protein
MVLRSAARASWSSPRARADWALRSWLSACLERATFSKPLPRPRLVLCRYLKRCPKCITGTVAIVAYITDSKIVLKILAHLHLPTEVPAPSPARRSRLFEDISQRDEAEVEVPWETNEGEDDPRTRAPP